MKAKGKKKEGRNGGELRTQHITIYPVIKELKILYGGSSSMKPFFPFLLPQRKKKRLNDFTLTNKEIL